MGSACKQLPVTLMFTVSETIAGSPPVPFTSSDILCVPTPSPDIMSGRDPYMHREGKT